jgi:hypothetical protein
MFSSEAAMQRAVGLPTRPAIANHEQVLLRPITRVLFRAGTMLPPVLRAVPQRLTVLLQLQVAAAVPIAAQAAPVVAAVPIAAQAAPVAAAALTAGQAAPVAAAVLTAGPAAPLAAAVLTAGPAQVDQ